MPNCTIDGKDIFTEFGAALQPYAVPAAIPAIRLIEIPGRDGQLDMTNANGETRYKNAEFELVFMWQDDAMAYQPKAAALRNYLLGQRRTVVFEDAPAWFYKVRFTQSGFETEENIATLTFNCVSDPYKYKTEKTVVSSSVGSEMNVYSDANSTASEINYAAGTIDVTCKCVTAETGSGTKSPSNPYTLGGKSSVTIGAHGKNLLPCATFEATSLNGITVESLGNGSYHIYGTSTAGVSITKTLDNVVTLPNTPFYLHYRNNTASGLAAFIFYPPTGGLITNYSFNPANRISEIPQLKGATVGRIGFYIQANVTLDITFTPTLEFSNANTDYEPFAGADYTLTPASPLYGLSGAEDEISNAGAVTHRTGIIVLDGVTDGKKMAVVSQSSGFNVARITLSGVTIIATDANNGFPLCSHFATSITTAAGNIRSNQWSFYLIHTDQTLATVEAWNAWLAAQYAAGTPVTIVYALSASTTETITAQAIAVIEGTKTVTLANSRMTVCPEITCNAAMTLSWTAGGVSYTYNAPVGTSKTLDLQLKQGDTQITVTGYGTISFEWQEGSL